MGALSGLKKFMYSALSAVVMFFVSRALFDWFNSFADAQIANSNGSIAPMLLFVKEIANFVAFDIFSFLLAIVAAVVTFIKVVED